MGYQNRKKVVFCHKKCEKFGIRYLIIFFSKNFQPTNPTEKALCTKKHFSKGPVTFQKIKNFTIWVWGRGGPNRKVFFGKGSKKKFWPSALKPLGSKNWEKKVVFWLKKMWKFRIRHPFFFFLKKFSTHQCGRKGTFHQKAFFHRKLG